MAFVGEVAKEVVGGVVDLGRSLIDRFGPEDPTKKAEARHQFEMAVLNGELAAQIKQIELNAIDAQSESFWKSGWRPGVGWVGVASLAMLYIPKAIVLTVLWTWQGVVIVSAWKGAGPPPTLPAFPDLGVTDMIGLLMSILGVGAMRSIDKRAGQ